MVKKISIVGTGGVGSNLAFHIISHLNIPELILLDIKVAQAEATACDLEDTRGILNFSTQIKATKNYSEIKNSDIIIFSAGLRRKQGMDRIDLLRANASIAKEAARAIKKYCPRSIIIAITNPLDIITYLILKETGFNRKKVMGMGSSLDTSRLLNILWQDSGVAASSHRAFAWGPHSKDMFLDFDKQFILSKEDQGKKQKIIDRVRFRGAKIVELFQDKSAVFAPSLACFKLIEAIAFNKNQVIPVSVRLDGEYGLSNICLGVPCLINKEGAAKVMQIQLTSGQKNELKKISLSLQATHKKI